MSLFWFFVFVTISTLLLSIAATHLAVLIARMGAFMAGNLESLTFTIVDWLLPGVCIGLFFFAKFAFEMANLW